uniref:Quinone-forming monooxygenase n=1 Tax=Streptomyces sp. SANK 61196 TaxID=764784 RepID=E2EKJ4_9ACTN|nr:quinone-forming monooxygenase [Streptomyces sp. SANK 61196]
MVEILFEQNLLWAVLAAVFWAFAARGARRLSTRPTARRIRRRARLGLILLTVALLALAARVALAVALAVEAGWRAASDFVLLAALPPALAGAAVLAFAVPAYWRLARPAREDAAAVQTTAIRTAVEAATVGTAAVQAAGRAEPGEPDRIRATGPDNEAEADGAVAGAATRGRETALARVGAESAAREGTDAGDQPRTGPDRADRDFRAQDAASEGGHDHVRGGAPDGDATPAHGGDGPGHGGRPSSGGTRAEAATGPDGPPGRDPGQNPDRGSAPAPPPAPALEPQPDPEPGPEPVRSRILASRARLVVPVRVAALATVVGAAMTLHPPTPPYTGVLLLELALLAVAAGGLLLLQQRRHAAVGAPDWRPPSRVKRLTRSVAVVTGFAVLLVGGCTVVAEQSKLPDRMGDSHHQHAYDTGGGPAAGSEPARDVSKLTGPRTGTPDRRFTLTAEDRTVRLASGEKVAALSFNGTLPGPELRMRRGELVEVTLVNRDVKGGVTVHWHGVDVPNAEDGVAGVTQNAVRPGERHVYRFRPPRAGTFWYHSHQQSSTAVARGLFGALVVTEPDATVRGLDRTVVAHAWPIAGAKGGDAGPPRGGGGGGGGGGALSGQNGLGGVQRTALGDDTRLQRQKVPAGTPVRLRLINADNCPRTYSLAGTPFKVAAIDGNEVSGPTELKGERLRIAGGGRYDVVFSQPAEPVRLSVVGDANASGGGRGLEGCGEDGEYGTDRVESSSLLLAPADILASASASASATASDTSAPEPVDGPLFDPLDYGTRGDGVPFGPGTDYDRDFHLVLGNSFGYYDGRPMALWTINNAIYPDIPALLVKEGDTVRTTFVNRSLDDHPMHLHGHRMLVLSKDGNKSTGSPWWTDTLNIAPGERYEVAFTADNPGLWMDHCHNLDHARDGMVLHLAYDGVTTPYETGRSTGNLPE